MFIRLEDPTPCSRGRILEPICSCAILDNVLYEGGGWCGVHCLNIVGSIALNDDCSHHRVADTPTYGCSLSSLCGQLVMSGGHVDDSVSSPVSNMVSVLSPSLNTWLPLLSMRQQRVDQGTCTVGDDTVMVVVGGWNDGVGLLSSVELLKL